MLNNKQKADCLQYDPFEGCRRDDFERELQDKIVLGRVEIKCCDCGETTKPKTHHRVYTEVSDGKVRSCRWCEECCAAMAAWVNGDEEPMMERIRSALMKNENGALS